MMKKLLTVKLSLIIFSLISTTAFAHSGHLANDGIHSFLHVEHIAVITAIGLITYFAYVIRNK